MKLNILKANRKKAILLLAIILCSAGAAFAQSERVNLPIRQMTGAEIFTEIEKQTNYKFAYDKTVFDASQNIILSDTQTDVKGVLAQMFQGKHIRYAVHGNVIILSPFLSQKPATNPAARPARTSDTYVPNALGGVSADARPRPEIITITHEPVVVEVEKERHFPESYSVYTSVSNYTQSYSIAPRFAIKTNLLYTAATLTPNLGFEFAVGPRSTIELTGSYNWQGREDAASANHKQKVHMILRGEYRRWLCERFNGHFFGAHAIYSRYNVSGYDVPLLFKKDSRYDGNAFGAGVSYGYHWAFAKRWGAEFNVGLGYMYMKYDQFGCAKCETVGTAKEKHYFGPTRVGVSLVFLIK